MISQYCTVAQLYGHVLAPRPPDAIELAFDGQIYGVDGPFGVGTPGWRLMPPPEDIVGVRNIQITMQAVLSRISDPSNAITIVTASQRAIQSSPGNGLDEPFPFFLASKLGYFTRNTGTLFATEQYSGRKDQ